jgi:hypothetical protein
MSRRIFTTGPLTDAQIKGIYAVAEKLKVGVGLWQDTPGPSRSSFRWAVEGSILRVGKMVKYLRSLG